MNQWLWFHKLDLVISDSDSISCTSPLWSCWLQRNEWVKSISRGEEWLKRQTWFNSIYCALFLHWSSLLFPLPFHPQNLLNQTALDMFFNNLHFSFCALSDESLCWLRTLQRDQDLNSPKKPIFFRLIGSGWHATHAACHKMGDLNVVTSGDNMY